MAKFTIQEALTDLPALLTVVQKISDGVSGLPPSGRKASDYSRLLVSVLPDIAALIDQIEAQTKDEPATGPSGGPTRNA